VQPVGAAHVGEALAFATQLEVGTAPFGAASGGFLIRLAPSTGLQVRASTTFGPAFAERALTAGEGNVSVGVNFLSSGFTRLDDMDVHNLQLHTSTATLPQNGRDGSADFDLSSKTLVISARMGITDNLDVGTYVPIVALKFNGTSLLKDGAGNTILTGQGSDLAKGIGDVAALVKYRFVSFHGGGLPDPGGLALLVTMRLPTGDKANLRGLGTTRTMASLIASGGKGKFRPHANGGFEYWSKGLTVTSDNPPNSTVTARHQVQYAAGFELEAAPKLTIVVDFLGAHTLGGGRLGFESDSTTVSGITSSSSLVALPEGIQRLSLAPGLKANIKGKLLLSVNALIALHDTGLHAKVTPTAGIELTF